jgi:hypothetical protein
LLEEPSGLPEVDVTIWAKLRRYPTVFAFAILSETLLIAVELASNPLTPVCIALDMLMFHVLFLYTRIAVLDGQQMFKFY